MGSIYFNGQLVKEFTTEFPVKNGLKRNKFIGGGVLVLAQQQVNFQFDVQKIYKFYMCHCEEHITMNVH